MSDLEFAMLCNLVFCLTSFRIVVEDGLDAVVESDGVGVHKIKGFNKTNVSNLFN